VATRSPWRHRIASPETNHGTRTCVLCVPCSDKPGSRYLTCTRMKTLDELCTATGPAPGPRQTQTPAHLMTGTSPASARTRARPSGAKHSRANAVMAAPAAGSAGPSAMRRLSSSTMAR
jgi:hypothetical protein